MVRYPLWHLAGGIFIFAISLVPKQFRFTSALAFARVLAPILSRSRFRIAVPEAFIETPVDAALRCVLSYMNAYGVAYDPDVELVDESGMRDALNDGRGVLVVGRHGPSSVVAMRVMHGRGRQVVTIAEAGESAALAGVNPDVLLHPSNGYLLRVRTHLRQGDVVCALIDRASVGAESDREFYLDDFGFGIVVSEALIRVAVSCGAKVLFGAAHAGSRSMRTTLVSPRVSATTAEDITRDFAAFIAEDMRYVRKLEERDVPVRVLARRDTARANT